MGLSSGFFADTRTRPFREKRYFTGANLALKGTHSTSLRLPLTQVGLTCDRSTALVVCGRYDSNCQSSIRWGQRLVRKVTRGRPDGENIHDNSDLARCHGFVSHQLRAFILVSARLQLARSLVERQQWVSVEFLTFFSALSMLVLGTPADLASLRIVARAVFVLGSAEPPAEREE